MAFFARTAMTKCSRQSDMISCLFMAGLISATDEIRDEVSHDEVFW
jgi:hypothetical protein